MALSLIWWTLPKTAGGRHRATAPGYQWGGHRSHSIAVACCRLALPGFWRGAARFARRISCRRGSVSKFQRCSNSSTASSALPCLVWENYILMKSVLWVAFMPVCDFSWSSHSRRFIFGTGARHGTSGTSPCRSGCRSSGSLEECGPVGTLGTYHHLFQIGYKKIARGCKCRSRFCYASVVRWCPCFCQRRQLLATFFSRWWC